MVSAAANPAEAIRIISARKIFFMFVPSFVENVFPIPAGKHSPTKKSRRVNQGFAFFSLYPKRIEGQARLEYSESLDQRTQRLKRRGRRVFRRGRRGNPLRLSSESSAVIQSYLVNSITIASA